MLYCQDGQEVLRLARKATGAWHCEGAQEQFAREWAILKLEAWGRN